MDRWTDKMDDGISYKDFFEKLDSIHKDITEIKIQTTKTNGRVTQCEGVMSNHALAIRELVEYNRNQDKEINRLILKISIIIAIVSFIVYKTTGYILAL
jgi:hypothetical protein